MEGLNRRDAEKGEDIGIIGQEFNYELCYKRLKMGKKPQKRLVKTNRMETENKLLWISIRDSIKSLLAIFDV
jgi:hypothetical protein